MLKSQLIIDKAKYYLKDFFGRENAKEIDARLKDCEIFMVHPRNYLRHSMAFNAITDKRCDEKGLPHFDIEQKEVRHDWVKRVSLGEPTLLGICDHPYMICKNNNVYTLFPAGIFVHDAKNSGQSKTEYTDGCIMHELIHAATAGVADNKYFGGVGEYNKDVNEFLTETIAIYLTQQMHIEDGEVFNEHVPPDKALYDSVMKMDLIKDALSFLVGNKDVIVPAMFRPYEIENVKALNEVSKQCLHIDLGV